MAAATAGVRTMTAAQVPKPGADARLVGAAFDPIEAAPGTAHEWSSNIQGGAVGTAADSEDTLHFAEISGVRPMIEIYPLEKAAEACARMMSGEAEVRVVLTM
jgi:D-arabinose 1-dehydrogenase-like Zn-dependent alcohol dehydrogenase